MAAFNPELSQALAQKLRALHSPGNPVIFTNIWDAPSASLVLKHEKTKALATASYAVAASAGLEDDELTLEDNLIAIRRIRARMAKEGKAESIPLTCDLQDGYGEHLEECIEKVLELGAVGCNLEDSKTVNGKTALISPEEHVERIKTVVKIAKAKGVDDFVVNARTDSVLLGGTLQEAIDRGRLYLEAGACTVFVWGGLKRGLRDEEVRVLVRELNGRVNVICRKGEGMLSVKEIVNLGVARISMGPALWRAGMSAIESELGRLLDT
ncbi:carboxyvinyl-carboxyphosphonate phosphorylmutase [Bisporella sp. PMI_857]|nr:carboxyvinyl-carboxyphosphonate phosphorylmutase [Bisporella sp. PMI_857]